MFTRPRVALATCLLLAGCYSGAELSGVESGGGSTGTGPVGEATTASPGSTTGEDPASGGATVGASSGALDPTSGGDSTGAVGTSTGPVDPSVGTSGSTGDGGTGMADTGMMPGPSDVPEGPACADVADWAVVIAGVMHGGYSMRMQRARLPEDERASYDEYVGASSYAPLPGAGD